MQINHVTTGGQKWREDHSPRLCSALGADVWYGWPPWFFFWHLRTLYRESWLLASQSRDWPEASVPGLRMLFVSDVHPVSSPEFSLSRQCNALRNRCMWCRIPRPSSFQLVSCLLDGLRWTSACYKAILKNSNKFNEKIAGIISPEVLPNENL